MFARNSKVKNKKRIRYKFLRKRNEKYISLTYQRSKAVGKAVTVNELQKICIESTCGNKSLMCNDE